jgi:signal transduction histidine kinase
MEGDFASRLPVSRERDEIDRIAIAVNLMLDEIARLLDQLKYAGDNIAHELRTPLAVARAKLERALEGDCGEAGPRLKSAIDQLDRAAQTVAALLRISEMENGLREKRFFEIDLTAICVQTFEFYEPLAEAKSIRMTVALTETVWIRGDADLLREAVSNLVDNAVKFTPPGGAVQLAVRIERDRPRLEVSDSGPGVAPADRDRIFHRFYRAPVADGTVGQGLGLSLARTIAVLHGLDLRVEDNAPGARFVMTGDREAA